MTYSNPNLLTCSFRTDLPSPFAHTYTPPHRRSWRRWPADHQEVDRARGPSQVLPPDFLRRARKECCGGALRQARRQPSNPRLRGLTSQPTRASRPPRGTGQHDPATFTGRASGGEPLEHLSHHQNQHFQLSFYHQTPSPPLFPCIPPPPRRAANPPRNTGFTKAIHEEHRELANHLGLHPRLDVKPVI